jgi:lipopolysaccharide export system protein LptC
MIHRESIWYPLALAGGLAAVSFWLNQFAQIGNREGEAFWLHEPDFIVEEFQARAINRQGDLEYLLSASKMLHYPDDETTRLERPKLTRYTPGAAPIHVASERGLVTEKGDQVYLIDKVLLRREAWADQKELTLETELLQATPDQHRLRTDKPVVIREDGLTIHATGMEANTESRIITLKSRIRATYEVHTP